MGCSTLNYADDKSATKIHSPVKPYISEQCLPDWLIDSDQKFQACTEYPSQTLFTLKAQLRIFGAEPWAEPVWNVPLFSEIRYYFSVIFWARSRNAWVRLSFWVRSSPKKFSSGDVYRKKQCFIKNAKLHLMCFLNPYYVVFCVFQIHVAVFLIVFTKRKKVFIICHRNAFLCVFI